MHNAHGRAGQRVAKVFSCNESQAGEARDKGWDAAQKDPRMKAMDMPFDGKRMIYGGFAPLLDQ